MSCSFAVLQKLPPCSQKRIQGGGGFFCNHLFFFCNHFEELQTALLELIINNKPLAYLYPNTIETCFTLSHLLFGTQLLYSSKTT